MKKKIGEKIINIGFFLMKIDFLGGKLIRTTHGDLQKY
jgi:hypothetical protein